MGDRLDRLLQSDTKRRPPVPFNPWRPPPERPDRRTRKTYLDPTGDQAVGNIKKEKQRGSSRPQ